MAKKSALSRTIIIKFSLTRNKALTAMVGVLLCIMAVNLGCETLTLTTYYPAPYGVYSKMRVTEYIQSGAPGEEIIIGDISSFTGMAGEAGIYAKAGSARNLTMGAETDINLMPKNDLLLAPGGDLVLGPGIYFKDMCRWTNYDTATNKRTYCNGTINGTSVYTPATCDGWSVLATGFRASGGHPRGRTTAILFSDFFNAAGQGDIKDAATGKIPIMIMPSTNGVMLCCKLEEY